MRFQELDALRGLCALAVLSSHYTTVYAMLNPASAPPLFYFPWVAYRVQIFCMISGFVMTMILEKTKRPRDFIVARFTRLYPLYLVAVGLSTGMLLLFPLHGKSISLSQVLINATMLQTWFGVENLEGSYWYLAPELAFYAILLGLLVFKKGEYIEEIGLIGLMGVIFSYGHVPAVLVNTQLFFLWHLFYAGILFYRLKAKGDSWHRHAGLALCFIAQNLISDDFTSICCLAGCFIIFYLFIYGKLGWIINKPLVFLGGISYSLFLTHENMGWIIIAHLDAANANPWLRFFIPVAAAILLATMMTYCIERPAMSYLRNLYRQKFG